MALQAEKVVGQKQQAITSFPEDESFELKDRIFEEFNSLSVIYGEPSERFIVPFVSDCAP